MKEVPAKNKGLKKLPTEVRNKMGYKAKGGMAAKTEKAPAKKMAGGKVAKAPQKKAYGGKTKMMAGGKAKKK